MYVYMLFLYERKREREREKEGEERKEERPRHTQKKRGTCPAMNRRRPSDFRLAKKK